jgi:hypothetical protein
VFIGSMLHTSSSVASPAKPNEHSQKEKTKQQQQKL